MKSLIQLWPAKVVIVGFGMNESFAGALGLADFRQQLELYLNQLARFHPAAQWVLLSPTAVESGGQGPDRVARNRDLALYAQAVGETAKARNAVFVDLFTASQQAYATSQVRPSLQGSLLINLFRGCHRSKRSRVGTMVKAPVSFGLPQRPWQNLRLPRDLRSVFSPQKWNFLS